MTHFTRFRKKPLLPCKEPVWIEGLTHDGRGIARVDGQTIFIEGALPGEQVRFLCTRVYRDYAEGQVETILHTSPDRVTPYCAHFGICGGCCLQHLASHAQIEEKQKLLTDQLKRIGKIQEVPTCLPLTGPEWGYRHKARLGVKYVPKKGRVLVGFREKSSAYIAELQTCSILHPLIGEKLVSLSTLIGSLSIRQRLPQIEVAMGDKHGALVFRVLEKPSEKDRDVLSSFGTENGLDVYLQPEGPDSIIPLYPNTPTLLSYSVLQESITLSFHPTSFTQVNLEINRYMVQRVLEYLDLRPDDRVLDLFCGIGNFTLPIAKHAAHVVGVEGEKAAVERAHQNALGNGLPNIAFHVADLSQSLQGYAWATQQYDRLLLDPSRAGAEAVLSYLPYWQPSKIVYVSCNPATLARDTGIIVHQYGYRLMKAGVMDMFPHTAHVESIALFEK